MFFDILKLLFGRKTLKQKDIISKEKLNRWQTEKKILQREITIAEEKEEIKQQKKEIKLPFSKKLMIFLFLNSVLLEIGVGWVTWSSIHIAYATGGTPDFTPLVSLIGIIIGQTLSYGIYSYKSKAENTQGGIVFETTMKEYDKEAKG